MLVVRQRVEDAVAAEVQCRDTDRRLCLHDFAHIVEWISDSVVARMSHVQHSSLDDQDHSYIRRTSARMVRLRIAPRRFRKHDRVVCYLGGERAWAPGIIVKLDLDDDSDASSDQIPYLVQIDAPNSRLVCVPADSNDLVRAEVCHEQTRDALTFTLFCKPRWQSKRWRRFAAGDRVACAVRNATHDDIVWAAGTVLDLNYDSTPDDIKISPRWAWPCADGIVPYRVLLDTGEHVLVHRDEHWLVRDLLLQPAGPHQSTVGMSLTRFTKRRANDVRLWTPQQTHFFPRHFRRQALATLCAAQRLRAHPPSSAKVTLGDLPIELLLVIVAASTGREQIDHMTRQVRVQSEFDLVLEH